MIWSLPGLWGLAHWWGPGLPIGGRWSSGPLSSPRRQQSCEIADAQLIAAAVDGNSVVLDCLTTADLVTLRARLTRKAVRPVRCTFEAWRDSGGWIGVTVARDLRTVRLATDDREIELQLEQQ